ncbi:Uncharacterised protein [Lelliottia amnigena]|uniref:STAS-like domain-containing protein n=1 Tax=Lelliottia amnigena TaxID=61646 RepID=UPI000743E4F9|nr:STAS-like domain-containing protein [Lelliottia amnigena]ATG01272.1 DUF4325 domain-containing protein [Lelliottia amnigena]PEG63388.1 DUF4325 domain-containing protein [Lelliottia amnigena]QXA21567.1 STAS-like domain-containing protein [Lelliottia amnigena]VDZ89225.1 Uncharacterised protein [Lelliottia amnigena]
MKFINVAKDFSKTPFGRFSTDGPNNGEKFRKEHLVSAFSTSDAEQVIVDFDGISLVIGSSFFEEAFGGLVRLENMDKVNLLNRLVIKARTPIYEIQIRKFVKAATPQLKEA